MAGSAIPRHTITKGTESCRILQVPKTACSILYFAFKTSSWIICRRESAGRERAPRWHQKPCFLALPCLAVRGEHGRGCSDGDAKVDLWKCPAWVCFPFTRAVPYWPVLAKALPPLAKRCSRQCSNWNRFQPSAALLSKYLVEMLLQPFYFFINMSQARQRNVAYVKMLIE